MQDVPRLATFAADCVTPSREAEVVRVHRLVGVVGALARACRRPSRVRRLAGGPPDLRPSPCRSVCGCHLGGLLGSQGLGTRDGQPAQHGLRRAVPCLVACLRAGARARPTTQVGANSRGAPNSRPCMPGLAKVDAQPNVTGRRGASAIQLAEGCLERFARSRRPCSAACAISSGVTVAPTPARRIDSRRALATPSGVVAILRSSMPSSSSPTVAAVERRPRCAPRAAPARPFGPADALVLARGRRSFAGSGRLPELAERRLSRLGKPAKLLGRQRKLVPTDDALALRSAHTR